MIVKSDKAAITEAARIIRAGGVVAFPTETVYGLGADATKGLAVARIFEAKGRPRFNPLIAHVADLEAALGLAQFDEKALALARHFWPGPLTLVLPLSQHPTHRISELVTAGLETVAIRIPAHPAARDLLAAAAVPIAAPSANKSGRVSPTRAEHVEADFGGEVDMILDGGSSEAGLESTIVTLAPQPTLLRREQLPARISKRFWIAVSQTSAKAKCNRRVSFSAIMRRGQHCGSTLGPLCRARRFWDLVRSHPRRPYNLSPTGDLREAAANLFAYLRALDAQQPSGIAVMPIPEAGLGEAINDRLRRASAPKELKF